MPAARQEWTGACARALPGGGARVRPEGNGNRLPFRTPGQGRCSPPPPDTVTRPMLLG